MFNTLDFSQKAEKLYKHMFKVSQVYNYFMYFLGSYLRVKNITLIL